VFIALIAIAGWGCWRLDSAGIGKLARKDLPVLALQLEVVDSKGLKLDGEASLLQASADAAARKAEKDTAPLARSAQCRVYTGGDLDFAKRGKRTEETFAAGCAPEAKWKIIHHPVSASLYFADYDDLVAWMSTNADARRFLASRLARGIFSELIATGSIRGEDLQIDALKGAAVSHIAGEALGADAVLHYDIAHGNKGFVFSFVRQKCALGSKALPLLVRKLARSAYLVPGLDEPVLEMMLGRQRIFLAEYGKRIYAANGLEALLNVLDNLPLERTSGAKGSVVLVVRAEAFLKEILALADEGMRLGLEFAFDLSAEDAGPGELKMGRAKFLKALRPELAQGVLAAAPRDSFAVLALSFDFPAGKAASEWSVAEEEGGAYSITGTDEPAGIAVVWDLGANSDDTLTEIGFAVSRRPESPPSEVYRAYFGQRVFHSTCGGGSVFLAATSDKLLLRMREACEAQSPSILALGGAGADQVFEGVQAAMLLNPGAALRELFMAGRPLDLIMRSEGAAEPQWKKAYYAAFDALQKESAQVFSSVPALLYAGADPAFGQEAVTLRGYALAQRGRK